MTILETVALTITISIVNVIILLVMIYKHTGSKKDDSLAQKVKALESKVSDLDRKLRKVYRGP